MSVTITVPDSVVSAIRLPEPEVEERLRMELAIALYAQEILSLREGSGVGGNGSDSIRPIAWQARDSRHYSDEDLARDLRYAGN